MVIVLKKELSKTNNSNELEDIDKYRQLLVRSLHHLSVKFPDVAANIIPGKLKMFAKFSNICQVCSAYNTDICYHIINRILLKKGYISGVQLN